MEPGPVTGVPLGVVMGPLAGFTLVLQPIPLTVTLVVMLLGPFVCTYPVAWFQGQNIPGCPHGPVLSYNCVVPTYGVKITVFPSKPSGSAVLMGLLATNWYRFIPPRSPIGSRFNHRWIFGS